MIWVTVVENRLVRGKYRRTLYTHCHLYVPSLSPSIFDCHWVVVETGQSHESMSVFAHLRLKFKDRIGQMTDDTGIGCKCCCNVVTSIGSSGIIDKKKMGILGIPDVFHTTKIGKADTCSFLGAMSASSVQVQDTQTRPRKCGRQHPISPRSDLLIKEY